jgi:hypothetical protein
LPFRHRCLGLQRRVDRQIPACGRGIRAQAGRRVKRVFVDSGAFFALLVAQDASHTAATTMFPTRSGRRLNKPDSPVNTRPRGRRGRASRGVSPPRSRPGTSLLRPGGALRRADPAQRADRSTPRPAPRSRPAPMAPRLPRRCDTRPRHRAPAGEGRGSSSMAGRGWASGALPRSPRPPRRGSGRCSRGR